MKDGSQQPTHLFPGQSLKGQGDFVQSRTAQHGAQVHSSPKIEGLPSNYKNNFSHQKTNRV